MTQREMTLKETLMTFSEWLDTEGLIVGDDDSGDTRTHEDLAKDFVLDWNSAPRGARLVGDSDDPSDQ